MSFESFIEDQVLEIAIQFKKQSEWKLYWNYLEFIKKKKRTKV